MTSDAKCYAPFIKLLINFIYAVLLGLFSPFFACLFIEFKTKGQEFMSGSWQIISPAEVCGFVTPVHDLISTQNKVYKKPTILVASKISGDEEIPDGVVAVLTPDTPDVLSHISIRARNKKAYDLSLF